MENTPQKKPKWLRKLEEESWQAELVISGLAIFGSLASPYYIDLFTDWCITYFQPKNYLMLTFFIMYLYAASTFLIISFVLHFILRTIWVGLLGLNSVFPKGINYETDNYSSFFLEKMKEKFPNNHEDIINLEKACSLMFAIATSGTLMILLINGNLIIIAGLKYVLDHFLSATILKWIGIILLLFVVVIIPVFMLILNQKRFHPNQKLQLIYFHVSTFISKIYSHVLYYPLTRITYVFATNSTSKKYGYAYFAIFLFIGLIAGAQLDSSNFHLMEDEMSLNNYFKNTNRIIPAHYETNLDPSKTILSALIPTQEIEGDWLKVFVPVFANESILMDSLCGEWEKDDNLSKEENSQKRLSFWVDCAHQYHRFYINDRQYKVDIAKYTHSNKMEKGILTYLPTQNFQQGKNILTIEKIRVNGGIYRTIKIPFWYVFER